MRLPSISRLMPRTQPAQLEILQWRTVASMVKSEDSERNKVLDPDSDSFALLTLLFVAIGPIKT